MFSSRTSDIHPLNCCMERHFAYQENFLYPQQMELVPEPQNSGMQLIKAMRSLCPTLPRQQKGFPVRVCDDLNTCTHEFLRRAAMPL